MTAAEQIEEVLKETIEALPRLRMEELEDLERRMMAIAQLLGPGVVESTPALRSKVNLLEAHLATTAKNLKVLHRVVKREATGSW